MPSNTYDDAYYAQTLSSLKEQLSNWVLKHESIIQTNLAHVPVEAFSGLNLVFSEVKSGQFAETYRKSSFFRTALLQQFISNRICHDILSGAVGPANLDASFSGLGKFFTSGYDNEGLRKKVLQPCIELASKMLQENRVLVPMMIPAGTLFDSKYCTSSSLESQSTGGSVLFCQFPMVAGKQGPKCYVVSKAPVNMSSEWSFASAPGFAGAYTSGVMLAGPEAITYKPLATPSTAMLLSESMNEKSSGHTQSIEHSEMNSTRLAYDAHYAERRASKFKKLAIGFAVLSLLFLIGLAIAAGLAGQRHSHKGGQMTGASASSGSTSVLSSMGDNSSSMSTGSAANAGAIETAVGHGASPMSTTMTITSSSVSKRI